MRRFLACLALSLAPCSAYAADTPGLTSMVFVERAVADGRGRTRVVLELPGRVASGDRLVFMVGYRDAVAANGSRFVVTPLPATVAYQGTTDRGAVVSIDGGHRWGPLSHLRVRERDGSVRDARAEDVTHVRWTVDPAAAAGYRGKLMFRGIVR